MGLFSGITSLVKDVSSAISPVTDLFSGGLGTAISGGLSLLGGIQTNSANAAQAQANRDFQADQTGTAYQRAVADLKAAGLNPMLAYTNGGAASGSGAQAVMQNAIGGAVNTAQSARLNSAQVQNLSAQNDQIRSQTDLNRSNSISALASAGASNAMAAKARVDAAETLQRIKSGQSEADWNASHPRTVGIGRYISTIGPALGGAHSAASTFNLLTK